MEGEQQDTKQPQVVVENAEKAPKTRNLNEASETDIRPSRKNAASSSSSSSGKKKEEPYGRDQDDEHAQEDQEVQQKTAGGLHVDSEVDLPHNQERAIGKQGTEVRYGQQRNQIMRVAEPEGGAEESLAENTELVNAQSLSQPQQAEESTDAIQQQMLLAQINEEQQLQLAQQQHLIEQNNQLLQQQTQELQQREHAKRMRQQQISTAYQTRQLQYDQQLQIQQQLQGRKADRVRSPSSNLVRQVAPARRNASNSGLISNLSGGHANQVYNPAAQFGQGQRSKSRRSKSRLYSGGASRQIQNSNSGYTLGASSGAGQRKMMAGRSSEGGRMLAPASQNTFTTAASRTGGVRPPNVPKPINRVNLQSADPRVRANPNRRRNMTTMYGNATRVNGGATSGQITVHYQDQHQNNQKTYSMYEPDEVQRAMNVVSSADMDNITQDEGIKTIDVMIDGDGITDIAGNDTTIDVSTAAHKHSEQQRLLQGNRSQNEIVQVNNIVKSGKNMRGSDAVLNQSAANSQLQTRNHSRDAREGHQSQQQIMQRGNETMQFDAGQAANLMQTINSDEQQIWKKKRQSAMLPSAYVRTDLQKPLIGHTMFTESEKTSQYTDAKTRCPTGPADYSKEHLLGNDQIRVANQKSNPKVSFTKALTHRTVTPAQVRRAGDHSRSRSGPRTRPASTMRSQGGTFSTIGAEQNAFTLETFSGSPARNKPTSDTLMIFHKLDHHIGPGVYDYDTMKARDTLLSKSPKATIGSAVRFQRNKLKDYVETTSHQYVKRHDQLLKRPAEGGTFKRELRWVEPTPKDQKPGVGDYDLTNFKSFAKASETTFEMPKYYKVGAMSGTRRLSKSGRARSAMPRRDHDTITDRNFDRSKSPGGSESQSQMALGVQMGRRLGGPTNPVCNFMMQASRNQRTKVYARENESANMNTLGPGPAIYSDMGLKPILYGSRDKHTIGREKRNLGLKADPNKVPITHVSAESHLNLTCRKGSTAIIGNYKQRFNVTQMNPLHAKAWQKGVIFY